MEYNSSQKKIIENTSPYIQVIAGAGSGKTKTMIGKIIHNLQTQEHLEDKMLVVTFSRKATTEIQERLTTEVGQTKLKISTFHAYCFQTLKKFDDNFQRKNFSIFSGEEKKEFLTHFFRKYRFRVGGIPFEILENKRILQENFPDLVPKLQVELETHKKENSLLEFEDMIKLYLTAFQQGKKWTEKAKSEVRNIIVDEFQDTDPAQLQLLQYLQPKNLTIVGDDWQAIYDFRGASVEPFLQFQTIFTPCDVNYLTINYRSLSSIITVSSQVIKKNKKNIPKKIVPFRKGRGLVKRFEIEEIADILQFIEKFIEKTEKYKILCRSNYRLSEYLSIGIPSENLLTIHASKGLEFSTVLVDLCDGWYMKAKLPLSTLEEERRILYVALSRAKDKLYIIGSNDKNSTRRIEDLFYSYFKWKVGKLSI